MIPRPAATLMLVRDDDGLEVFLQRRNSQLEFAPGMHVFPGGAVDAVDDAALVGPHSRGLDDATASQLIGVARGGLAFWAAAIREAFEEAGVLLAVDNGGRPADPTVMNGDRAAIDRGEIGLAELCRRYGLKLAADSLAYMGHWITPLGPPRRYDTRFFLAEVPPGQVPDHDEREAVASEWVRPVEALERFERGELGLIEPTLACLELLAEYSSVGALSAAVAAAAPVAGAVPVEPSHGGWRIAARATATTTGELR